MIALDYTRYRHNYIKHVFYHGCFIIITSIILPILVVISVYLLESYNNLFHILVYTVLSVFSLDFISLIMETLYLYGKRSFPNLKFIYVLLFIITLPLCLTIIAFGFQDLLDDYKIYYTYKLLGCILVIFIVMYDTSKYYSDHYKYELTHKSYYLSDDYTINEKYYNLNFFEISVKDISAIYVLVLTLINKKLNNIFNFDFQSYSLGLNNILSPYSGNFDSAALIIFCISIIIFVFVDILVRYFIRRYFRYTGDLN